MRDGNSDMPAPLPADHDNDPGPRIRLSRRHQAARILHGDKLSFEVDDLPVSDGLDRCYRDLLDAHHVGPGAPRPGVPRSRPADSPRGLHRPDRLPAVWLSMLRLRRGWRYR